MHSHMVADAFGSENARHSAMAVGKHNEAHRVAWVRQALESIPSGSRILDAGAGEGAFRKYCSHLKYFDFVTLTNVLLWSSKFLSASMRIDSLLSLTVPVFQLQNDFLPGHVTTGQKTSKQFFYI